MKKKSIIFIITLLFITSLIYFNKLNKCKDVNYSLNNYFTTGVFNEYKLNRITEKTITFSNGTLSVFKIEGLNAKSPHKKMFYNVFIEKNNKGIWKVKKIYTLAE